ncbi:AAA family ATPase [Streptomyces sp. NPDC048324]|uniref:AAA family ATPase n=1 Tax=Streptomyces sp. NPDC048324 TaxID=3157205 RepID=UPI0034421B56
MPSSSPDREPRRILLAVGTANYVAGAEPRDVAPSLRTVVDALAERGVPSMDSEPGYRLNADREEIAEAVRQAAMAADVVILYYVGHSHSPTGGRFYLLLHDSTLRNCRKDALAAAELPEFLQRVDESGCPTEQQPTALIMLDCCYAGTGTREVLRDALQGYGNPRIWFLASAGRSPAGLGYFAKALATTLRNPPTGPVDPYLSLESIVEAVNEAHGRQVAHFFTPASGATGTPPFFRNKNYDPEAVGLTVAERHWLSKVRAGPEASTIGYYLTGRTGRLRAAEKLTSWIIDPGRRGLAVVTGSPGTGKSTLLALPVHLTQAERRDRLLAPDAPDPLITHTADLLPADTPLVPIHAHGCNTDQVARAIADRFDLPVTTTSEVLNHVGADPKRAEAVVLVDAIDEAVDPAALLNTLLIPLARDHGVKLVLGARRHVLTPIGAPDLAIDLDTEPYHDPEALTDYIRLLLLASRETGVTSPYQVGPHLDEAQSAQMTRTVAEALAEKATDATGGRRAESFLIGQLLARSIRSRPVAVDTTSADWHERLPAGVGEAFEEELALLGDEALLARAVLTALAWANGPGLPWENIWARVATALTGRPGEEGFISVKNSDVRWLLDTVGAYITVDVGPGRRSVFRLVHDLLGAHLRGEPTTQATGTDPATAEAWGQRRLRTQQVITQTLLSTVPSSGRPGRRTWLSAHPYLRTYLAQHAAAADPETFAALVRDPDFLAAADPLTLTPLLGPTTSGPRDIARAYRRVRPLLGDDPWDNAAYLREAAHALTGRPSMAGHAEIPPRYRTCLASVRRDDSLLTITGCVDPVASVALGDTGDGRFLLATGNGTMMRLWDPATGAAVGAPLATDTDPYQSNAVASTPDGRLLLAAGGGDGPVRLQDPATGTQVGEPLAAINDVVTSVAFGNTPEGRLLTAVSSWATVRLADPTAGALASDREIYIADSFAFVSSPDGRLLLATGCPGGTVALWDATTGTAVGKPFEAQTGRVTSLALGTTPAGHLMLATGSPGDRVRLWLWNPTTNTPALVGRLPDSVEPLAFATTPDRRLILATGGSDCTVRLWDPTSRTPVGEPLYGHTSPVKSLAFGRTPESHLLLASGSEDCTCRLWDPTEERGTSGDEPPTGHTGAVTAVAFGKRKQQLVLATSSQDHTVRLWTPTKIPTDSDLLKELTGHVTSVAFGTRPGGRTWLATGNRLYSASLWDPRTYAKIGKPLHGHDGAVTSVAFGTTPQGHPLLATGSEDRTVRLWDPRTYAKIGKPLHGHDGAVTSVAFGTTPQGHPLLATGSKDPTVRLWEWDPTTRTMTYKPSLHGHDRAVTSVAFGTTPQGHALLATGSEDRTVRLWEWDPTAQTMTYRHSLDGHEGTVTSTAFIETPKDALLVATGSRDHTVRLWNPTTGQCLKVLRRRSEVLSLGGTSQMLAIGDDEGVSVIELSGL